MDKLSVITPEIVAKHGLSVKEYALIQKILGRDPNINELGVYSVLWSEHCSYKHSKKQLKKFPTTGKYVLQGPGENAGVVSIGDGLGVAFKIESHNHPSALEPYQGAATGVGGIIRDIFTMGARPVAGLNSLRFGNIARDSHQRWLFDGVVAGIAGYGNCIGVPTVAGEVYFEDSYSGNCLVNAGCLGIVQTGDKVVHELYGPMVKGLAAGPGNPIYYFGAATGRDGIHGATFASVELTEESENQKSSVQVGDPFHEKLLLEACLELIKTGCVVGMQDMGAAGLTSSTSEMASRAGTGVEIDVAKIPAREKGMTPYEFLLSESQERMVAVVEKGKEHVAEAVFRKWGLNAVIMGQVTADKMFRILENGKVVAEVPADSLAKDAPVYDPVATRPEYLDQLQNYDLASLPDISPQDIGKILLILLGTPNIASKSWVYEQYDHMVQINTMILPGKADACVLRIKGTDKKIATACDCNGRLCYLDPFRGGKWAIVETARNLTCVGAEPIGITDCLNFGNPEKPETFYQFSQCIDGMVEACEGLTIPVVSGNVSFYNESGNQAIYPTPTIGMVGIIKPDTPTIDMGFKNNGDKLYLLCPAPLAGDAKYLGGSEYIKTIHGQIVGRIREIDIKKECKLQKLVRDLIEQGITNAVHDVSDGGLLVAIAEMAITGNKGVIIQADIPIEIRNDIFWFAEGTGFVLAVPETRLNIFTKAVEEYPTYMLGEVKGQTMNLPAYNLDISTHNLINTYHQTIPGIMND